VSAQAVVLAARSRTLRRLVLAGVCLLVAFPILCITAAVSWFSAAGSQAQAPAWIGPATGIPPQYVPLYNEAGRAFGVNPFLLAAIHKHETGFSTNPDTYRINFAGCCIGAMQMNVTDGTWRSVADAYRQAERPGDYPHPDTPHPQPTDDFDAIMAAAKLLRIKAGGRPIRELDQTAWLAARNYNGAGPVAEAYATAVLQTAKEFERASRAPPRGGSALAWPVPAGTPVTSPFCERRAWEACHPGVDLGVPAGTPIWAAADGRVTVAGVVSGYGNYICIQHELHLATCYGHLSRFASGVHVGAPVEQGEVIALSGCTGLCFGAHLHFEVRLGSGLPAPVVNPLDYLPRR
jgi:Peptidase family M23